MAIGYACMLIGVRGTGLSRCILKNASEENLRSITKSNLSALEAMIDYNIQNNIKLFRISSDIIPFGSHPINQLRWWEEEQEVLYKIGQKIKQNKIRVSMHPGQYTVLNAPEKLVVQKAVMDLVYHSRFLDALGMDQSGKLVLHIGGVYGDKAAAKNTFIQNYLRLPQEIRSRLILENDDKNYTIQEVLSISDEIGAPVVFDNLHHQVNASEEILSEPEWISKCGRTWKMEDGKQKLHYSQQKAGAMPGSHSDTVSIGPFLKFYQELKGEDVDIMLEVKDKNLSALKCINTAVLEGNTNVLYAEWNRYQHFVLSRSEDLYQEINILLESEIVNRTIRFYDRIEKALTLPDNPSDEVKAANHVWEYFSKDSTLIERNRYDKLISAYGNGTGSIQPVKNHLLKCARVRDYDELMNSLYFYL